MAQRCYIDPSIPKALANFEIVFRYHSARYEIAVENPHGVSRGVPRRARRQRRCRKPSARSVWRTTARRITYALFSGDGDSDANALQFGARPHFSAGQGAIHPAFSRGMTENDGSSRSRRPSGAPRHSRLNGGKALRPIHCSERRPAGGLP